MSSNFVKIVEVGPRDGLQNEPTIWSVAARVALINRLSLCGFQEIEVGSFVSPKWVPQMADTDKVFLQIDKVPGTLYSVLVPNHHGLDEAIACGAQNISVFTAASETFNLKNTNCSIAESFQRIEKVVAKAKPLGIRVRGYVSCIVDCPYEGPVLPSQVLDVAGQLHDLGCDEISLGDTIGNGTPEHIDLLLKTITPVVPVDRLAIHCHDTYGQAMDNIMAALAVGVRTVDSAVFGLGGCPYAGGKAKGNVATEAVVPALRKAGYTVSISDEALGDLLREQPYMRSAGTG